MNKKTKTGMYMSITVDMTEEELELFKSFKNIRGIGKIITEILIAYAHENGCDSTDIRTLYGYALVSEAERKKKGE